VRRRWLELSCAVAVLALPATQSRSADSRPGSGAEAPDPELLLNLDLLRETDLRRDRELLRWLRLIESLRLLEAGKLLEPPTAETRGQP
jgi:hypothetical protein